MPEYAVYVATMVEPARTTEKSYIRLLSDDARSKCTFESPTNLGAVSAMTNAYPTTLPIDYPTAHFDARDRIPALPPPFVFDSPRTGN